MMSNSKEQGCFYVTISNTMGEVTRLRDAVVTIEGSRQFYPLETLSAFMSELPGRGSVHIVHVSAIPDSANHLRPRPDYTFTIQV